MDTPLKIGFSDPIFREGIGLKIANNCCRIRCAAVLRAFQVCLVLFCFAAGGPKERWHRSHEHHCRAL